MPLTKLDKNERAHGEKANKSKYDSQLGLWLTGAFRSSMQETW